MSIASAYKMCLKAVKLKWQTFISLSYGALELMRKNPKGEGISPPPPRYSWVKGGFPTQIHHSMSEYEWINVSTLILLEDLRGYHRDLKLAIWQEISPQELKKLISPVFPFTVSFHTCLLSKVYRQTMHFRFAHYSLV